MLRFTFSDLSLTNLNSIIRFYEKGIADDKWNQRIKELNEAEKQMICGIC